MLWTKNISMSSITGPKNATVLYRVSTAHMREGELAHFCSWQHSALRRVVKKSTYRGFPLPKAPKTSGGAHFAERKETLLVEKPPDAPLSLSTTFYLRSISITRSMAFVCNSTRSIT